MLALLKRLWAEDEGQGLVEYALIIPVVAVLVIGGLIFLKDWLVETYQGIPGAIQQGGST